MKRRDFIQSSALSAVALYLAACGKSEQKSENVGSSGNETAKKEWPIGLQLYTLRDTIMTDPKGVLSKVASFGYKELETFGYADGKIFGLTFSEFNDHVKSLGMKVVSGHYPYDLAKSDKWEQAVTDAKSIGQEYIVIPYLNDTDRKSIDDYKTVCENLNKAGEIVNKHGLRMGYHNHAFEFETLDGQVPYDVMLAELDQKNVGMELDIYWVYRAGQDALQLFEKHPGRFEQWHVKDMDKIDKDKNADVGTGTIDWRSIFAKADQSGMKHFYIEQESYPGQPIDSVEASFKNLDTIV